MAKASQINRFTDPTVQTEVENIYNILNKLSFGQAISQRSENMDAFLVELTATVSAVDISASHDLKRTPIGWITYWQNVSGTLYDNSSGLNANTDTVFWFRSSAVGSFRIILI